MTGKTVLKTTLKILKGTLIALGSLFLVMLVLALTSAPYYMHYALGKDPNRSHDTTEFIPDYVVMFGGAGMPSESNLIRLYYTSQYATHYNIPVVIAHPEDSICQTEMARMLTQSGVKPKDIHFMTEGTNTRSQVLELGKTYPHLVNSKLLVITSPEHMRRTVKCLNKAGFAQVRGMAAREATVDFNLSLRRQDLKGNKAIPSVESPTVRYNFWNYLQLEIICFREYAALTYYKLKGWI